MADADGTKATWKNGLFHFSTMFSFDAFTAQSGGFPLLFQTGETYKGQPIVDRQHPHDLFSELSVSYSQALSTKADVFVMLATLVRACFGTCGFHALAISVSLIRTFPFPIIGWMLHTLTFWCCHNWLQIC